ncbi:ATP phosphoribosyltransferase regulatory subunit [Aestuariibius sp. 2305UL40-4]|uniref:ATP phosphoribosyltransferase regulatory subunit n=1 Tax=Aestuariibius violaceus TaxID=3234132 RepID=UPI00345EE2BF
MTAPALRAEADRLLGHFTDRGASPFETAILQPAETLLDLYGEDIRARAYTTLDPHRGEMMLRPDFTVPLVQHHMTHGADPARYAYAGQVFRRQEDHPDRPAEFLQVGYEIFDRTNPAKADAEVFAAIHDALTPLGLTPSTGDLGILGAAIDGLSTTDARKRALKRHIWRPARFRDLLNRFTDPPSRPEAPQTDAPLIGKRTAGEIAARHKALAEEAATPPLSRSDRETLDAILALRDTVPTALASLRGLARTMPHLTPATDRLEARLDALSALGIDAQTLPFQTTFGRTLLEYYDGFVFGFSRGPGTQPVATGGRYDALTRLLGDGRAIPAVGGIIRPDLALEAAG